MTKQKRAKLIQNILNKYFSNPEMPLKFHDGFSLLIAVLLSSQTTDERVNKTTPRLFKRAPTTKEMAQISKEELEKIIKPLGLFRNKAKNIIALSQMLYEKNKKKQDINTIPSTFQELEELPGVGHKTASVVLGCYFLKNQLFL